MKHCSRIPYEKMDGIMWHVILETPAQCMINFVAEVDMSSVGALREKYQAALGSKPSYTAVMVKAIAIAVAQHPYANRRVFTRPFYRRAYQFESVDISVAVERESVMHACHESLRTADKMTLREIGDKLRWATSPETESETRWAFFKKLVKYSPEWLVKIMNAIPRLSPSLWLKHRGGAILLSSPAKYGVDVITGCWTWPVAFSFGLIKKRPVVVEGDRIEARPTTSLSMVFDRRTMMGAPAARFFRSVCDILEHAETRLCDFAECRHASADPNSFSAVDKLSAHSLRQLAGV